MHLDTGPPDVARAGSTMPERDLPHPLAGTIPADPSAPAALVTIVIPTKDRPDLIRRSVATALAQEGVAIEVVVIDDGSAFPAADAIAPEPRVRVLRNETSQGVARARNRGIEAATTEWVAFLDDDDLWAPDKLARQLAATVEGGYAWSHTGTLRLTEALAVDELYAPAQGETSLAMLISANRVYTPSTVLASTTALREAGGFDPSLSIMADWELWLRLASKHPAGAVQEPLVGYVVHERSMHRQNTKAHLRELRQIKRKHRAAGPVRSPGAWRWIASIRWKTGRRISALPIAAVSAALYLRQPWFGPDGLVTRVRRRLRRHLAGLHAGPQLAPPWVARWTLSSAAAEPAAPTAAQPAPATAD